MWSVIFASLAVGMLAVLVAGQVRPAWFADKKDGELPKRSELAAGSVFLIILFAGLSAFLAPEAETQAAGVDAKPSLAGASDSNAGSAQLASETKTLWKALVSATEPCDEAAKTFSKSAQGEFDVYELYRQAKCRANVR